MRRLETATSLRLAIEPYALEGGIGENGRNQPGTIGLAFFASRVA
jgi:hypothetical protein